MKNLLLGFSLAANVILGYALVKDSDGIDYLVDKLDGLGDQFKGKAEQVEGTLKDDPAQKLAGDFDEEKGNVKDKINDIKSDLTD
ncbi:hypothetical protein B808_268 [Fructilactobacillus florum 8D]|uniref:CsbD family protein n=2 Tax=Fructilactobacillus florum TaxID=640331 RepID=W9EMB2_9LACO|nr:CsbD family protein [Fructilactobacillus florum]EKK20585.1 hypothetical protein B807_650 [Fructilactobacillus florum 2F]ETO40809.1 hypothetical protein B808_268 [Fructilactobacillus florum 8D]KRM90531.1 hypothetical protein FC87_GL001217 [Fructilactobacillus florum DSM 22689 = JCM 16035]